jgi:hypothetical protein
MAGIQTGAEMKVGKMKVGKKFFGCQKSSVEFEQ